MVGLVTLDLSNNSLSGSIPMSLEGLRYFLNFDVCFNTLNGEIPSGGSFRHFTLESFKGKGAICGNQTVFTGIPLCLAMSRHKSERKKVQIALYILTEVVALVTIVTLAFIFIRHRRKDMALSRVDESTSIIPQRISYYQIMQATEQFNGTNLLGIESYDEEMIAHVCDFGISKLLRDEESTVLTNTFATLSLLPQSPDQVIDVNLFINLGDERGEKIIECVSSILVVALKCSKESPLERINIKEALAELQRIKHGYF
ncbi:hypothetical protein ACS0TY_022606 [Phlomoides rotata]